MEFTYVSPSEVKDKEFTYQPPQEKKSLGSARLPVAATTRAAESALGFIPNVIEGAQGLAAHGVSKISEALGGPELYSQYQNIRKIAKEHKHHIPTQQDIHEKVSRPLVEKAGINPEELEPQNSAERIGFNVAGSLPLIASTGGAPFWQQLAGAAGSATGQELAEQAGWGPFGQFAAAIGGGFAPNLLNKTGTSIEKFKVKQIEPARRIAYKNAEIPAEKIKWPTANAKTKVDSLIESIESGLPTATHEAAGLKQAQALSEYLQSPDLSLKKIWDKKKAFNKIARSTHNETEKEYFKTLANILEGELQQAGTKIPEFGRNYNLGENLTRGIHAQSDISKLLEKHSSLGKIITNGTAAGALMMLTGQTSILKKAAIAGLTKPAASIAKAYDLFRHHPEARNIVLDLAKSAAIKDEKEVAQLLRQLNTLAEQSDMEEAEFTYQK